MSESVNRNDSYFVGLLQMKQNVENSSFTNGNKTHDLLTFLLCD